MAHKSKTQRAKASVAKANRKERQLRDEASAENAAASEGSEEKGAKAIAKSTSTTNKPAQTKKEETKPAKPKKQRFQFLKDVRAEMKRVTWPTRTDVIRWSGVVVGALLFFGIYVAVLDNLIITPGLVALSSLGA